MKSQITSTSSQSLSSSLCAHAGTGIHDHERNPFLAVRHRQRRDATSKQAMGNTDGHWHWQHFQDATLLSTAAMSSQPQIRASSISAIKWQCSIGTVAASIHLPPVLLTALLPIDIQRQQQFENTSTPACARREINNDPLLRHETMGKVQVANDWCPSLSRCSSGRSIRHTTSSTNRTRRTPTTQTCSLGSSKWYPLFLYPFRIYQYWGDSYKTRFIPSCSSHVPPTAHHPSSSPFYLFSHSQCTSCTPLFLDFTLPKPGRIIDRVSEYHIHTDHISLHNLTSTFFISTWSSRPLTSARRTYTQSKPCASSFRPQIYPSALHTFLFFFVSSLGHHPPRFRVQFVSSLARLAVVVVAEQRRRRRVAFSTTRFNLGAGDSS
jgi:hypothetical protein